MSLEERLRDNILDVRFQDPLYPPVQSTPIVLSLEPVLCPKGTYRLYIGGTGDLIAKLIGDDEFRTFKALPVGAVLEGMFYEISNDTTAGDIIALHTYNEPED